MMFSNSRGSSSRPLRSSVYWKSWPFRRGRRADLPGRDFLALLLDDVDDVLRHQSPRLQKVRVQPYAHGVLPGAEDRHIADAGEAAQFVLHIDDRVVRQEQAVEAAVGGVEDDELEDRRRLLLRRHALELHFLRQRRNRRRHAVLHQDLILVGIRADREGDDQGVRAVARVRRLHVDHVLDAVDVLLDRQSDGVDERHGACAGIARRHLDGWRDDVRILRARQVKKRDQADENEDERQHIGEHWPADEKARDRSRSAFRAHFVIRGGRRRPSQGSPPARGSAEASWPRCGSTFAPGKAR